MKKYLLILLVLSGCTSYTRSDKIALVIFLTSQTTDMYTTRQVLQSGGEEYNPLLPSHPSDQQLLVVKGIDTGFFLLLAEIFPKHRKQIFGLGSVLRFGISYHNYEER